MTTLSDRIVARIGEAMGLPTGTSEGELLDVDILLAANRVYQIELVNRIHGWGHRGSVDVALVQGTTILDSTVDLGLGTGGLPARFKGIQKPLLIDDWPIYMTTIPEIFWDRYRKTDVSQSRPTGALYYGARMELRPISDQAYTLTIHGALYRALAIEALPDNGPLVDPIEEDAIVYGATLRLAGEQGMDETKGRYEGLYGNALTELAARSHTNSGERRRRRQF